MVVVVSVVCVFLVIAVVVASVVAFGFVDFFVAF